MNNAYDKNIKALESEIRRYINNPRKQFQLLETPAAWNKLTSSLDVIGDTELAIDAFLTIDWPKDDGTKYLFIYGIMQALFIQQDAVKNLSEALGIRYPPYSLLQDIRQIRHDSIGHPTKRENKGKELGYNFITRMSMSRIGFMLMKTFPDRKSPEFVTVNIPDLITKQREILAKLLNEIIDKLSKEEKEHRLMFKGHKLQDIFPKTLGYYFEKIYESIYGTKPNSSGAFHIGLVSDCVNKFKVELEKRSILNNHEYSINELDYPINEIKKYFEEPSESKLNDKDVYIFTYFIDKKIDYLQQIAKEIDEEYSKDM